MRSRGVIFRRALVDNRRSIFWWGLGIGIMGLYVVIAYPLIEEFEEFASMFESPVFQAILGDIGELDYTTPTGFLGIEFFSWIPLILAVYAVMFGLSITGSEENKGTADLLLSTPTPRWQVIVEKYLAYIVCVSAILAISFVFLWIGIALTPSMQEGLSGLVGGMVNILPSMFLIGAFALFLTTVLPTTGQAGGITAAAIVASYFLNSLADMAKEPIMTALQNFSFYKYYAPFRVLADGINWGNWLLLTAIGAAFFGLAIYFYERRDLYV